MSDPVHRLTLGEVAAAIRDRRLSSREVVQAAIERAERLQPRLNAFISLDGDRALDAADRADASLARARPLARCMACRSPTRTCSTAPDEP